MVEVLKMHDVLENLEGEVYDLIDAASTIFTTDRPDDAGDADDVASGICAAVRSALSWFEDNHRRAQLLDPFDPASMRLSQHFPAMQADQVGGDQNVQRRLAQQ